MRNIASLIIVLITFLSCNQSKNTSQLSSNLISENNIKKIEISEFNSSPKNYNLLKYNCISIEITDSKYIEYTYQDGVLKNKKNIKTFNNIKDISKIFNNIPIKYLNKNEIFGNPNAADDGGISVLIFLNNNKTVTWTLDYDYELHPKEIKLLIQEYRKIKDSLKIWLFKKFEK